MGKEYIRSKINKKITDQVREVEGNMIKDAKMGYLHLSDEEKDIIEKKIIKIWGEMPKFMKKRVDFKDFRKHEFKNYSIIKCKEIKGKSI